MFKNSRLVFVLLSILYFSLRIFNLTLLPVFGDEAIYLDWAWRMTHEPGLLYFSLNDGKQPLLFWIFGILENFFKDPLFAGRFVSVVFGYLTMIGIYKIGKKYFSVNVAYISALLYITIPILSFFDRQALMEAAISTIGVWAVWYFLSWQQTQRYQDALKMGLVLGIGLFIKSTVIIFLITGLVLGAYVVITKKILKRGLKHAAILIGAVAVVLSLLLINPIFWSTLSMNSRYGNSLYDLLGFPISLWLKNISVNAEIILFFVTPLVFITVLGGVFMISRIKGLSAKKTILLWVILSIVLQTILVKGSMSRYLVSFLPLLTLFSAYFVAGVLKSNRVIGALLLALVVLVPLLLTLFSIFYPSEYLRSYKNLTPQTDIAYVQSSSSGYGVDRLLSSINKIQTAEGKRIFVGIAENAGIPESALQMYYQKSDQVTIAYFGDPTSSLDEYDCLKADQSIYFVSRNDETPGITKFLDKIEVIKNDYNLNTFGIWKLKEKCVGKSISVSLEKQ